MEPIDVLKGTGKVVSGGGDVTVQYCLEVYEHGTVGWIRPYIGEENERLILKMQDGSGLRFLFTEKDGSVASSELPAALG